MPQPLLEEPNTLHEATIRSRPNRFILEVEFKNGTTDEIYLANTGARTPIQPGRTVLAREATNPDRKTDYDAVFVKTDSTWISIIATAANDAFEAALERDLLPPFKNYDLIETEPTLPSGGRADFKLETPDGDHALVEVKSCTHADDGVAKFPDRPTERGRRHLRELMDHVESGHEAHVVFVIQRDDADEFAPFRSVDPEFADTLVEADAAGVHLHAIQLRVEPPAVYLHETAVPITLE
ncbi:MAG: DNA/RNA nuclease SfsA [Halodesulfurarchaeum sp.]